MNDLTRFLHTSIDKMMDALANHINEQRADAYDQGYDDDNAQPICIHVAEAYNIGHGTLEKARTVTHVENEGENHVMV